MKSLRSLLLLFLVACFCVVFAEAAQSNDRVKTTKSLRWLKSKKKVTSAARDLFLPDRDSIVVAGFDKPLLSLKETFFVSNHYNRSLKYLRLRIKYYDNSSRQIHERSVDVTCNIPSGQSRLLSVDSFDTQRSFYYVGSRAPRVEAYSFDVSIFVEAAELE